jgi:uncharacterized membrane protein
MNDLAVAFGIGALSGSRSMLGPALVGRRLAPAVAQRVLTLLAAGEMVADKSTLIPARTEVLPLAGRVTTGALAAAGLARRDRRVAAAVAGAMGALAGTYAWYHLRRLATVRLGLSNMAAGLAEDALAVGAGALLLRAATR